MATATQKAHTGTPVGYGRPNREASTGTQVVVRAGRKAPTSASMMFLVEQDNCGGYHWVILASDGERLVRSTSSASYETAERAALRVRAGAGSARLQPPLADDRKASVLDRRDTAASEESERWLDKGGSLRRATATK